MLRTHHCMDGHDLVYFGLCKLDSYQRGSELVHYVVHSRNSSSVVALMHIEEGRVIEKKKVIERDEAILQELSQISMPAS